MTSHQKAGRGTAAREDAGAAGQTDGDDRPVLGRLTETFAQRWQLDDTERAGLLGCDTARAAQIVAGEVVIEDEHTKTRLRVVLEIAATLAALFRSKEVENEWLREPRELLDGHTPLARLTDGTDEGLAWVEELVCRAANQGGA